MQPQRKAFRGITRSMRPGKKQQSVFRHYGLPLFGFLGIGSWFMYYFKTRADRQNHANQQALYELQMDSWGQYMGQVDPEKEHEKMLAEMKDDWEYVRVPRPWEQGKKSRVKSRLDQAEEEAAKMR